MRRIVHLWDAENHVTQQTCGVVALTLRSRALSGDSCAWRAILRLAIFPELKFESPVQAPDIHGFTGRNHLPIRRDDQQGIGQGGCGNIARTLPPDQLHFCIFEFAR
jgi:hypothetical protein